MTELGVRTDVFVYRPTELYGTPDIYPVDGEIAGVNYHYPNTRKYSKYRIFRAIGRFYYWGVTCWKIYKANKDQKIDLNKRIDELYARIESEGVDILYSAFFTTCERFLDMPRKQEVFAVINRMRRINYSK